MDPNQHWIVNDAGLIYESLDGEVIIIQPETGYYYSLDPVASRLWTALQHGASAATLAGLTPRPASVGMDTVVTDCVAFLQSLADESLVIQAAEASDAEAADPTVLTGDAGYLAPRLQKYTDMEEFFLLDPIHEIDDAGWPVARADGTPERGSAPG